MAGLAQIPGMAIEWSGLDIRDPPGRELVKRMSNPKLHSHLYSLVVL